MSIKRISSGGEFEAKVGYCRAVVAGGFVHVAGTVGQGDDVVEQCRSALDIIARPWMRRAAVLNRLYE